MARGFTLMEVIVVLGIFVAVTAFTLFMGVDAIARGSLKSERDTLVSLLVGARTEAMANVDAVQHGVHIDATNFVTFAGATYVAGAVGNITTPRTTGVTGGSGDIVFTQLSGAAQGATSIALTDGPQTVTIDITSAGRIEW